MNFKHVGCNICGQDRTEIIGKRSDPAGDSKQEADIVRCLECGLMYPNPMPLPDDTKVQSNFGDPEKYFPGLITAGRIKKYERLLKVLEKETGRKGKILDVGCGRGEFLYAAKNSGWDGFGTDISKTFVKFGAEHFGVRAIAGDIRTLDIGEGPFDVVCLNSVIQYVSDPLGTLKRIYSLLNEGGSLYIEATNEDALVFAAADIFKSISEGRKATTHLSPLFPSFQLYGFNKRSIGKALSLSGFKVRWLKIRGMRGGGMIKGKSLKNDVLNFLRRIVIFLGGISGNGHLMYCLAKKGE